MIGWPDREIARIAASQHALVTRSQLVGLGIGPSAIEHALARGRLHRIHRGVYALVASTALPLLAAEHAAVLACGDTAVLSHHSAAAVWRIRPFLTGNVDVTVVGTEAGRRRAGICVHRIAGLHPRDALQHSRIPITSPARTLLEITPQLSERSLERAFDEALIRNIMSLGAVRAVLARYPQRPGVARMRALTRPDRMTTATRSKGEERFLAMVRKACLPAPEVNVTVGRFNADFLWRRERIVLEVDGYDFHRGVARSSATTSATPSISMQTSSSFGRRGASSRTRPRRFSCGSRRRWRDAPSVTAGEGLVKLPPSLCRA